MKDLLTSYKEQRTSEYRNETYDVRDNGAIYRHQKRNARKRPLDETWTFGNPNKQTGYLNIASETVHRIVATAFHGPQPSPNHVVDHIDTNRKNNRPENLRWVTRLENLLLNPISLSRIRYKYGSIDKFLADPASPIHGDLEQNFEWMRTVTEEEAKNTRERLISWAKEGKLPKGGGMSEWVFSNSPIPPTTFDPEGEFTESLTPNALQKNWKSPSEFPNCPDHITDQWIDSYESALKVGAIFSKNQYGQSTVDDIGTNHDELLILTKSDGVKPYALAKVYVHNDKFVHESLGSFFKLNGAQKQFTLALGLEWDGGETFDDFA